MITNMNCAVMGILGPGIYLGTVEPWPVNWCFQKRVYFSEASSEMHYGGL